MARMGLKLEATGQSQDAVVLISILDRGQFSSCKTANITALSTNSELLHF